MTRKNGKPRSSSKNHELKALNENQQKYIDSIEQNTITFAIGEAGSGKSSVAVGMAVRLLKERKVEKIIITRPIVQSGRDLGALPGSYEEKIYPFLIPLFDELEKYSDTVEINNWQENGQLEIAPVEYFRGRTFINCFVIVDESSNLTYEQFKMVLTRIGEGSKFIINGDPTQSDLPYHKRGGLEKIVQILKDTPDIGIIRLEVADIVRHPLIKTIIEKLNLYEKEEAECKNQNKALA